MNSFYAKNLLCKRKYVHKTMKRNAQYIIAPLKNQIAAFDACEPYVGKKWHRRK